MATYKVIQDIEAEDKLLGPLTLRQFVYAGIVAFMGFICFKLASVAWWLTLPFLPPILFFGLLAAPFGKDQSTEVWLLAKIRFMLKPRKRIWDQNGLKHLVTVTVPRKLERRLTDGLSQGEVKSRLRALADTIDSRGWSTKNVNVNMFMAPGYNSVTATINNSDRLIPMGTMPHEVPAFDVGAAEDMLDPRNNPRAQQLNQMIQSSTQAHHEQAVAIARGQMAPPATYPIQSPSAPIANPAPPADYWFLNGVGAQPQGPGQATFGSGQVISNATPASPVAPLQPTMPTQSSPAPLQATNNISTEEESKLLEQIHKEKAKQNKQTHSHLKTIRTPQEIEDERLAEARRATEEATTKAAMTHSTNPAILNLANNDDLDVATIQRQANKPSGASRHGDEVVISLH